MTIHCMNMEDVNLENKRVLIRVDLNVPISQGIIQNDARIRAILPTIQRALAQNARIILLSHLGRPIAEQPTLSLSLKPVTNALSQHLNYPVRFAADWLNGLEVAQKEIVLCENVRFNRGELENDPALAKRIAALCDVFVMDAFATAHRSEASTVGVAQYAPIAAAGPLLSSELEALNRVLQSPKRPLVAIVGGAKVSDKLPLLQSLIEKVDTLIVGGGIANAFIALGHAIGGSLFEPSSLPVARALLQTATERNINFLLPVDAIVACSLSNDASTRVSDLTDLQPDEKIFDVGPSTIETYLPILKTAGTLLWNGPLGVFENPLFSIGTARLAEVIASAPAFSIAGGGETATIIDQHNLRNQFSYVSTGGGAFLQYLEGKPLPAVAALEKRAQQCTRL